MAKQIKNLVYLALLLVSASGLAQIRHTSRIKIPFSFMAAGRNWAAGDYSVVFDSYSGFVTLNSFGVDSATVGTSPGDPSGEVGHNYLRFQTDGEHRILQAVQLDGNARTIGLKKSERELLKAGLSKSPEQRDIINVARGTN